MGKESKLGKLLRTWSFTHLGYLLVWEGSENGLCMVFFLPNLVHPSVLVNG